MLLARNTTSMLLEQERPVIIPSLGGLDRLYYRKKPVILVDDSQATSHVLGGWVVRAKRTPCVAVRDRVSFVRID